VNNKVILFLNGEPPLSYPDLTIYDKVFCTDGSYSYLKENNIKPDYITGDFDSIQLEQISSEITIIPTPDQNFTDFEKALKIIYDLGFNTVDVYGASGHQQDHFIGNLNAAFKYKSKLNIQFFDNYSTYYFLSKNTKLEGVKQKTISLVPFPTASSVITKGLKYSLYKEDLNLIDRIGTRNTAIDNNIEITFDDGNLVIFIINN